MHPQTIGFIGGGRITRIFLEGWARARQLPPHITVSDPDADVREALQARFPAILTTTDNALAAGGDLVFLAVHPPLIETVAAGLRDHLQPDAIVVSLAPTFTLANLAGLLGGFDRLARVIPNAPSIIGAGFNPLVVGAALGMAEKARLAGLLAPLGECPEVAEDKLEAYALLTGMGPTYLWFQLQTLRELALEFGLNAAEITAALKGMVGGATLALLESGHDPAEVMDLTAVKPLAAMEPQVTAAYRTCLPDIYQKIKPDAGLHPAAADSKPFMNTPAKIAIILLVVLAAAAALMLKGGKAPAPSNAATPLAATVVDPLALSAADAAAKLPKLLDLGATKCIPCKMMAPVLVDLKQEYAGKMKVEFIDVWQNENAGKEYRVEMIPTQIFYDANGKELFRHTGFFGKKDILAKWQELGVTF